MGEEIKSGWETKYEGEKEGNREKKEENGNRGKKREKEGKRGKKREK